MSSSSKGILYSNFEKKKIVKSEEERKDTNVVKNLVQFSARSLFKVFLQCLRSQKTSSFVSFLAASSNYIVVVGHGQDH